MQHRGRSETAGGGGNQSAFLWAAERNSLGLLELQISRGINIEGRSKRRTALQLAARYGHTPIVERLLNEGTEVNAPASKKRWENSARGSS